jgi:Arylsulfotransferase (ASST)
MMTRATTLLGALAIAAGVCACGSTSAASPSLPAATDVSAHVADANPVAVSPEPGTPDASPDSQISFLGVGASAGVRVLGVRVVGSRSGVHGGMLRAYSTGTGESFLPAHPFAAGERVTVSASVEVGGAAHPASTSFTIAHQASVSSKEFPINAGNPHAVQRYSTAPSLTPSTVAITTHARSGAAPGYLFLAPYQGDGTAGPMIAEQDGGLVWFHPLPSGVESTNFQVQSYEGKPVLTWWQGRILEVGFGQGEDEIYDSSYRRVVTVRAGNGYHADLHEIRLASDGTAWIDMFDPIHMNLSPYGGPSNGIINDSVVQEIDVKTGLVMWEWHALGHIPPSESHKEMTHSSSSPWDYVHINSVDPGSEGDVLLSSRSTWALYDVDLRSGGVRWRLGGSHSSFKLGPGTRTYWQHDAEWQPGGLISVFDNGSDPPKEKQSRGLLLRADVATHTVTLVKQFTNPGRTLLASSQGNVLNLGDGDWLMGYGGLPNFTEYDASGHVLLDGTLGKSVQDFRTYMAPWNGHPTTPPAVLAKPGSGGTIGVSVSWNGATEVSSWRVLAGGSPSALATAGGAAKAGFQTTIAVPGPGPYVQVQALNAQGAVIGTSAAVKD